MVNNQYCSNVFWKKLYSFWNYALTFFLNSLNMFLYSIGRYYVVMSLQWFESYLSDRSFKVSWRGEVSKSQHLATGGASGLSSRTTSLLCLHGITTCCHSETWLFISLLCWWHSTLPLIPSWWSDDSCLHLSMSNRHFLLDEGPSPSTQPS